MTDKVQKIKEWISKEQDGLMDAQGNFEYPEHEGAYNILCNLDAYIDSLQEEPAPKIFEDMLNAKTPAESLGISAEEHEKIIDLCLYGKEPEMVDIDDLPKEEPVSEDLDEAAMKYAKLKHKDDVLQKIVSWDFKAGAQWQKEKMITNIADAMIGLPYENKDGGYTHLIDVSRPLPVGNNKIAIIFKED